MRSPILWLACSAAMLTPFVASAQTQQAASAQPAAMAQPVADVSGSNPVICHMVSHEGMLIRTNICHTAREWEAIRRHNEQDLQEFQQRGLMKN